MATTVDVEDLHTTKSEKLLAFVMLVFLLIGGLWAYQEVDEGVRTRIELGRPSAADSAALERRNQAQGRLRAAELRQGRARSEVEFRREEFRAALDAGRPAGALERRYRAAQAAFADAQAERRAAEQAFAAARPAAEEAGRREAARLEEQRDR